MLELETIKNSSDIKTTESDFKLSNNNILKKYKLESGFYYGMNNSAPGSGYIDFYEDKIFIVSSRGTLAFRNDFNLEYENFQQIKNNINYFIGFDQMKKSISFSVKDLMINKNKIYISYTEEIKEGCYNTSIIHGNINYKNIVFDKLFSHNECNYKSAYRAGGRIVQLDENHIILSNGDYGLEYLAQDKKSINGKLIKININNSKYEIISMGHRNPQGLYFDKENNFIIATEHGPKGGDEINLIEINKTVKDEIPNYGWAISSAGEHYEGDKKLYEKYPLYKSHIDHGFIEPLKSFVPSIAISEIVKIGKNKYVVSSMGSNKRIGDKTLYFFELNDEKKLINLEKLKVFERIRDLKFKNNKLYLFMEDSASIGIMDLFNDDAPVHFQETKF